MAVNTQWAIAGRNAFLSGGLAAALASGFCDIYSGAQPANGDTAVAGTLLASGQLPATALNAAASGQATNAAWTLTAGATGTAGYFVLYMSNHATVLGMGSIATATANMILPTTAIASGNTISIPSGTITFTADASVAGQ